MHTPSGAGRQGLFRGFCGVRLQSFGICPGLDSGAEPFQQSPQYQARASSAEGAGRECDSKRRIRKLPNEAGPVEDTAVHRTGCSFLRPRGRHLDRSPRRFACLNPVRVWCHPKLLKHVVKSRSTNRQTTVSSPCVPGGQIEIPTTAFLRIHLAPEIVHQKLLALISANCSPLKGLAHHESRVQSSIRPSVAVVLPTPARLMINDS